MDKERLVVLTGAGSTIAAGAPSTQDLTDHVQKLRFPAAIRVSSFLSNEADAKGKPRSLGYTISVCDLIWGALKANYEAPNFEHLIHSLELLEPLARLDFHEVVDEFRPVLSSFMDISQQYRIIFDPNLLNETRHKVLTEIAGKIANQICFTGPGREKALAILRDRLGEHLNLSVFTLNYDDLIDRTGPWFDGFLRPCEPNTGLRIPRAFDAQTFVARCQSEASVLAHLHGSPDSGIG